MNTLDFSAPVRNSKGEVPTQGGQTLGEVLSNVLLSSAIKPPMDAKYFSWGLELVKTGVIMVDDVDKKELLKLVNETDQLNVLGRGRLKEVLDPDNNSSQMKVITNDPPEEIVK